MLIRAWAEELEAAGISDRPATYIREAYQQKQSTVQFPEVDQSRGPYVAHGEGPQPTATASATSSRGGVSFEENEDSSNECGYLTRRFILRFQTHRTS